MTQAPMSRLALVTGSIQGIGLAIVEALAAENCHLVLPGLGNAAQQEVAREAVIEAGAMSLECHRHDLGDPRQVESLMKDVFSGGELNIPVNNAGIQQPALLVDLPAEVWDRILAVNLSAAFHTMKAAMPGMAARGYGGAVNITASMDCRRHQSCERHVRVRQHKLAISNWWKSNTRREWRIILFPSHACFIAR